MNNLKKTALLVCQAPVEVPNILQFYEEVRDKYNKITINIQTSKKLRKLQKALDKNVLGGGSLNVSKIEIGGFLEIMKKFMILMLSLAVLFSFAACDNSTVNPYFGKQVASVTLESTPDYLGGETINPADVELRVVYDDGTTAFITGDEAGALTAWDLRADSKLGRCEAHNGAVRDIALSQEGTVIATVGSDREILLWDTDTFKTSAIAQAKPLKMLQTKASDTRRAKFSSRNLLLALGSKINPE